MNETEDGLLLDDFRVLEILQEGHELLEHLVGDEVLGKREDEVVVGELLGLPGVKTLPHHAPLLFERLDKGTHVGNHVGRLDEEGVLRFFEAPGVLGLAPAPVMDGFVLGQSRDERPDLRPELLLHLDESVVAVFHCVVEEGRRDEDGCARVVGDDEAYLDRMDDIGHVGTPLAGLAGVELDGPEDGALDERGVFLDLHTFGLNG